MAVTFSGSNDELWELGAQVGPSFSPADSSVGQVEKSTMLVRIAGTRTIHIIALTMRGGGTTLIFVDTNASVKNLENQVAQKMAMTLAERIPSILPGNTEINLKESLKALILRSGKQLSSPTLKEAEIKIFDPQPRA